MGMAQLLFAESCKRTNSKPVTFTVKDTDGECLTTTLKTKTAPRDYSQAELERVAADGLESSASKKIEATGVTVKMPRTDAAGKNARELIGIVFGSALDSAFPGIDPATRAAIDADASRPAETVRI